MKAFQKFIACLNPYVLSSIASVLTIAQIVFAFFFVGFGSDTLKWAGWICLWSAGIFGVWPIIIFRRKGGVPRGDSYIKTTALVDSGLYAVVRHPQGGTAWLLINLGILLIAWHWTGMVLGLISMALVYLDTFKADQSCIEKFGDAYRLYIKKVPRVNFITGIIRLAAKRNERFS